ncbi:hypothetical protein CTAYLR_009227 [Chrysophaeum taylorii]|uniref:Uncharacterized protein n=1 Tax=Chrysophaeum taylorii TaxID=2483200 RepID=A0AAD7XPW0_9STRA|nr:hypothetical protein CTAYLR_009227 [Chrysophaeum taylorii]
MSWHIHYTTNRSDMARFYGAFVSRFSDVIAPGVECPFGPNYGANSYKYVCSLESAILEGSPWTTAQRAFFVPLEYAEVAWTYAKQIRGYLDILLHPNTGCMHDDHSVRAQWVVETTVPTINTLEFPRNVPRTGCNDSSWPDMEPACGCVTPVASDAPQDSCGNCNASLDLASFPLVSPSTAGFDCTDPPLSVEYAIDEYAWGQVRCGGLFLDRDVGDAAPKVSYAAADVDRSYLLMLVDPDADATAAWPDSLEPGSRAPQPISRRRLS